MRSPDFILSAAATIPAIFAHDPRVSVAFYCVAFFGLEWTVGISWAVPLDIGGDFAGSVSAVMNTLGNIGGALSAIVVTTAVSCIDWKAPFLITSALCIVAAILYLKDRRQKAYCMRINPGQMRGLRELHLRLSDGRHLHRSGHQARHHQSATNAWNATPVSTA